MVKKVKEFEHLLFTEGLKMLEVREGENCEGKKW